MREFQVKTRVIPTGGSPHYELLGSIEWPPEAVHGFMFIIDDRLFCNVPEFVVDDEEPGRADTALAKLIATGWESKVAVRVDKEAV